MKTWILTTTGNEPHPFGGGDSPYRKFEDDVNPNVILAHKFGSGNEYIFHEVVVDTPPVANEVIEDTVPNNTTGDDGKVYMGAFDDPVWRVTWTLTPITLDQSKTRKLRLLEIDRDTAMSAGYTSGPYNFEFSDKFYGFLGNKLYWLKTAVANGTIPANTSLTFSDTSGKQVSANTTQLESNYSSYGMAFNLISEKEVNKRNQINNATTLAEVDAVTWTF